MLEFSESLFSTNYKPLTTVISNLVKLVIQLLIFLDSLFIFITMVLQFHLINGLFTTLILIMGVLGLGLVDYFLYGNEIPRFNI
jgi:hypothetical protein